MGALELVPEFLEVFGAIREEEDVVGKDSWVGAVSSGLVGPWAHEGRDEQHGEWASLGDATLALVSYSDA